MDPTELAHSAALTARFRTIVAHLCGHDNPAAHDTRLVDLRPELAVFALSDDGLVVVLLVGEGGEGRVETMVHHLVEEVRPKRVDLLVVGEEPAREELEAAAGGTPHRLHPAWLGPYGQIWSPRGARPGSIVGGALEAYAAGGLPLPPEHWRALIDEARARALAARTAQQDFAEGLARRPVPISQAFTVLIGIVFAMETLWGGSESIRTLVRMGALVPGAGSWAEPWRLLSNSLLHAGIMHIGFNGYVAWKLGAFVEKLIGGPRLVLLFTLSALGGSLATLVFGAEAVTVGASGGIWGLLGALAWLSFQPGELIPPALQPGMRRMALQNLAMNLVVSFLPQVATAAHIGGGITGAALVAGGVLVAGVPSPTSTDPITTPPWLWGAASLCVAALLGSLGVAWAVGRPWG